MVNFAIFKAFSTIATVEAAYNLRVGSLRANFSEQNLLDCNYDTQFGCNGGWPEDGGNFVTLLSKALPDRKKVFSNSLGICEGQRSHVQRSLQRMRKLLRADLKETMSNDMNESNTMLPRRIFAMASPMPISQLRLYREPMSVTPP